jgi:hypothetical protein
MAQSILVQSYYGQNMFWIPEVEMGLRLINSVRLSLQKLPLAIWHVLNPNVRKAIIKVNRVFGRLCSKVVYKLWEAELMEDVVIALCMLEKEFLFGFFNIMTHLMIHLVKEFFICRPVHTQWMYLMERYMKYLKDYVRTKARPEGSMVEGYVMDDILGFCTMYMTRFIPTRRRVWDDKEEPGLFDEELEGGGIKRMLSANLQQWAHAFVLDNAAHLVGFRQHSFLSRRILILINDKNSVALL